MEDVNIRLECLKLAHRPDQGLEAVVARADKYVAFILDKKTETPKDPSPQAGQVLKGNKKITSGQG